MDPGRGEERFDVFLAHASPDRYRAEELRRRLDELGCIAVLDSDFLAAGAAWDDRLIAAQRSSRVTLVLLSPNVGVGEAGAAYYLKEEIALAIKMMRDGSGHQVVPVRVAPIEVAPYGLNRLHHWTAHDAAGLQAVAAEVAALLAEPDQRRSPRVVGAVPVVGDWFAARDDLLVQLERSDGCSLLTQALVGLGGVGKSTLAAAYARDMEHVFAIVWWVRAERPDTLETDLEALASRLGLNAEDRTARARAAIDTLERYPDPWLVVFDNATDRHLLERWLPRRGSGQVVITSRDQNLRQAGHVVQVAVFDHDVAVAFLCDRVRERNPVAADDRTAAAVASALQGLPLALEQAAAWVARNRSRTWGRYLELFASANNEPFPDGTRPAGYDATATTTWRVSVDAAGRESPLAPKLLAALAALAPDAIPSTCSPPTTRPAIRTSSRTRSTLRTRLTSSTATRSSTSTSTPPASTVLCSTPPAARPTRPHCRSPSIGLRQACQPT